MPGAQEALDTGHYSHDPVIHDVSIAYYARAQSKAHCLCHAPPQESGKVSALPWSPRCPQHPTRGRHSRMDLWLLASFRLQIIAIAT